MDRDELDQTTAKNICFNCIEEDFLQAQVKASGRRRKCAYCGGLRRSITVGELADEVERAFEQHFVRTSDQPNAWQYSLLSDRESSYEWEREGEPVTEAIGFAAQVSEEIAADVQAILEDRFEDVESARMGEETDFAAESHYERKELTAHAWQQEWMHFVNSLQSEARFFNASAAAHLASVFANLDDLRCDDGRPVVVSAGPQTPLAHAWRARAFQAEEELGKALCRPDLHLGPPPSKLAKAGRMNAAGVAVFYGSTSASVAVAEVRPPVGSHVAVADFSIIRPLRLLDLGALSSVIEEGSVFDPGYGARLERIVFLRTLCELVTRPVMPDDESRDYLPTQAVADFLAGRAESPLDGIVFPSVQAEGAHANVVLFHKSSKVSPMDLPEGTRISAHTGYASEDGWEPDFSVSEEVPRAAAMAEPKAPRATFGLLPVADDIPQLDLREAALSVDPQTVVVHRIKAVEYTTDAHRVSRHRFEQSQPPKPRADPLPEDFPF